MAFGIQTVFSTQLLPLVELEGRGVVVIDILRATTSICTALSNGARAIIPVASRDQARAMAERGYLVASERDGVRLDFARFGNSPSEFTPERVRGQEIVYCTTNGTAAIMAASRAHELLIGAFTNLSALSAYLSQGPSCDLVLLCSGWRGFFNLEDTLFAGALAERLLGDGAYETECDATRAAIQLWRVAQDDLLAYVQEVAHRRRLERLGLLESFSACFQLDTTPVVPQFSGGRIHPAPLARG